MRLLQCVAILGFFITIFHAQAETKDVSVLQTRNSEGYVISEISYDHLGREHGYARVWFSPGRNDESPRLGLAEERYSIHGKLSGAHRRWYAPGATLEVEPHGDELAEQNLRDIRRYQKGKSHGVSQLWLADGTPDGARCYKCGERDFIEACVFDFANATEFTQLCTTHESGRTPAAKLSHRN